MLLFNFQPTTSTIPEGSSNSKNSENRNTSNTINLNINGRVQEVDLPNQVK